MFNGVKGIDWRRLDKGKYRVGQPNGSSESRVVKRFSSGVVRISIPRRSIKKPMFNPTMLVTTVVILSSRSVQFHIVQTYCWIYDNGPYVLT